MGQPGAIPEAARVEVEQSLLHMIADAGRLSLPPTPNAINTGFIGNKYIFEVVTKINSTLALELALSTALPSYGYQITHNATTVWESWDGAGDSASHNHHFMGGIGAWLHKDVVGLSQGTGVGFSHPEISPKVILETALPSASGTWRTPRGEIAVAWAWAWASQHSSQHSSQLQLGVPVVNLNVSLPPNTRAKVVFPCGVGPTGSITEGGTPVWLDGSYAAGVAGVIAADICGGCTRKHVAFEVDGGGDFAFQGACV